MNNVLSLLLLLIALTSAQNAWSARPQRQVEVLWEKAPGAIKYMVEVRKPDGKVLKTFESKTPLLKFKASVGRYEIRAQLLTDEQRISLWSPWHPITVPPKAIKWGAVTDVTVNASMDQLTGRVKFELPREETAERYHLKFYTTEGKVFKETEVKASPLGPTSVAVDLPPGEYTYGVVSLAGKDFEAEEVRSPQKLVVKSIRRPGPVITRAKSGAGAIPTFEWSPVSQVLYKFKLEKSAFLSEEWKPLIEVKEVELAGRWQPPAALPAGRYRLSVWSEAKDFPPSQVTITDFEVKPTERDLGDDNLIEK